MEEAEKKIRTTFPNFDNLDLGSKKLLITGEYIYKTLDASPKDSDYSSVVAHYGRAIENELVKKLHLVWIEKKDYSLDRYRQNLINGILNSDPRLLKYIDKNELMKKKRKVKIFSEEYLGTDGVFKNCIQKERNAASHSGKDSVFDRAKADRVIKDMTDFLLEWTGVKFEEIKNDSPEEKILM
jgi:hypothetical protein